MSSTMAGIGPSASEMGIWHPIAGSPGIEVNWVYTATHEIGAGYHIFKGRALDAAGNLEAPYEIARVLWLPKASPDLSGSSVTASQTTARPGDELTFTIVAKRRRAGGACRHDGYAAERVTPVAESLPSDVLYDASAHTLTWPEQLLWPGQWVHHSFQVRVDAGLAVTSLENQATFQAFWPNTDLLPAADRQKFLDREQTVVAKARVTVDPTLPADADLTAPWVSLIQPHNEIVSSATVLLNIMAAPDATRMYVREWTPDPMTGNWIVRQNSGWTDYSPTYTWTLSAGQGVKFLGAWVMDNAGNVSRLSEHAMIFVNRLDGAQDLADGERVQYRGFLQESQFVKGVLTTVSGDPDVYIYGPRNAFSPDHYTNDTVLPGQMETFSNRFVVEGGRYLLEVQAVGASKYEISLTGSSHRVARANAAAVEKPLPQHPLTISNPLSAGQLGPEVSPYTRTYLPLMLRSQ